MLLNRTVISSDIVFLFGYLLFDKSNEISMRNLFPILVNLSSQFRFQFLDGKWWREKQRNRSLVLVDGEGYFASPARGCECNFDVCTVCNNVQNQPTFFLEWFSACTAEYHSVRVITVWNLDQSGKISRGFYIVQFRFYIIFGGVSFDNIISFMPSIKVMDFFVFFFLALNFEIRSNTRWRNKVYELLWVKTIVGIFHSFSPHNIF